VEKNFSESLSNPLKFVISMIQFVFVRSREKEKRRQH